MTNAKRDSNNVPVLMGILCSDGITQIPVAVNPLTGAFLNDNVSTISVTPETFARRDENFVPVMMATNSVTGDPIPVYVNAQGKILTDA